MAARRPKPTLLPPGTLICPPILVPGQPVPWKTPTVTRRGIPFKDKRLVAWQLHVATCSQAVREGSPPYAGPVEVELTLCRRCTQARRPGDYWDVRPDLDNLQKAIKDSLTGRAVRKLKINGTPVGEDFGKVLEDDNVVVRVRVIKVYGVADWVQIRLLALPTTLAVDDPAWDLARRPA
jgi:Holliday junction resolvase RusA-like endonuclease